MVTGKNVFPDSQRIVALLEGKFGEVSALPESIAEIAVIGRSNSGKTSLLKALLNCPNPPQVSSRPGSTRLMHLYRLGHSGAASRATLVDFPGYGYAQSSAVFRERFSRMLLDYLQSGRPVKAICLIMDCRREAGDEEKEIARIAKERRVPLLLCLNKCDQLNQSETAKLKARYQNAEGYFEIILMSAAKRLNLDYIRSYIVSAG
ncbi:MAG: ribosome biogenesis GTP-binding protein YihA/YsxC [Spirochaetota bacterium]